MRCFSRFAFILSASCTASCSASGLSDSGFRGEKMEERAFMAGSGFYVVWWCENGSGRGSALLRRSGLLAAEQQTLSRLPVFGSMVNERTRAVR